MFKFKSRGSDLGHRQLLGLLRGALTESVHFGEEAVVVELLADVVELDAEIRDVALLAQKFGAQEVPLLPQGAQLGLECPHASFVDSLLIFFIKRTEIILLGLSSRDQRCPLGRVTPARFLNRPECFV